MRCAILLRRMAWHFGSKLKSAEKSARHWRMLLAFTASQCSCTTWARLQKIIRKYLRRSTEDNMKNLASSKSCGSGSGIRDPGSGAFLAPGSGMGKKSGSGSGIWIQDEQPGSYFRELRNHFLGIRDGKTRIRD
jgi:hypothetical protein